MTVEPNSRYVPAGAVNLTSMNVTGSNIYLTDAGSTLSTGGAILPFTAGSGCSLSPQAGGAVANLPTTYDPVYSLTDSKNKFLYVVNHGSTNSQYANSTISAFVILVDRRVDAGFRPAESVSRSAMGPCAWWKIRRASMSTRPTRTTEA